MSTKACANTLEAIVTPSGNSGHTRKGHEIEWPVEKQYDGSDAFGRGGRKPKKKKGSAKMIVMQFDTIPPGRNHRCGATAPGAATRLVYVGLLGNSAGESFTA